MQQVQSNKQKGKTEERLPMIYRWFTLSTTQSTRSTKQRIIFYNPECNDVSYDMTYRYIIRHFFFWGGGAMVVKIDASKKSLQPFQVFLQVNYIYVIIICIKILFSYSNPSVTTLRKKEAPLDVYTDLLNVLNERRTSSVSSCLQCSASLFNRLKLGNFSSGLCVEPRFILEVTTNRIILRRQRSRPPVTSRTFIA